MGRGCGSRPPRPRLAGVEGDGEAVEGQPVAFRFRWIIPGLAGLRDMSGLGCTGSVANQPISQGRSAWASAPDCQSRSTGDVSKISCGEAGQCALNQPGGPTSSGRGLPGQGSVDNTSSSACKRTLDCGASSDLGSCHGNEWNWRVETEAQWFRVDDTGATVIVGSPMRAPTAISAGISASFAATITPGITKPCDVIANRRGCNGTQADCCGGYCCDDAGIAKAAGGECLISSGGSDWDGWGGWCFYTPTRSDIGFTLRVECVCTVYRLPRASIADGAAVGMKLGSDGPAADASSLATRIAGAGEQQLSGSSTSHKERRRGRAFAHTRRVVLGAETELSAGSASSVAAGVETADVADNIPGACCSTAASMTAVEKPGVTSDVQTASVGARAEANNETAVVAANTSTSTASGKTASGSASLIPFVPSPLLTELVGDGNSLSTHMPSDFKFSHRYGAPSTAAPGLEVGAVALSPPMMTEDLTLSSCRNLFLPPNAFDGVILSGHRRCAATVSPTSIDVGGNCDGGGGSEFEVVTQSPASCTTSATTATNSLSPSEQSPLPVSLGCVGATATMEECSQPTSAASTDDAAAANTTTCNWSCRLDDIGNSNRSQDRVWSSGCRRVEWLTPSHQPVALFNSEPSPPPRAPPTPASARPGAAVSALSAAGAKAARRAQAGALCMGGQRVSRASKTLCMPTASVSMFQSSVPEADEGLPAAVPAERASTLMLPLARARGGVAVARRQARAAPVAAPKPAIRPTTAR